MSIIQLSIHSNVEVYLIHGVSKKSLKIPKG